MAQVPSAFLLLKLDLQFQGYTFEATISYEQLTE